MSIKRIIKAIHLSFLAIAIIAGQRYSSKEINSIDHHLSEYSRYNITHHDNIDDQPHSHTHKHNEDGDEHEHNHEHSKASQSENKLLSHSFEILAKSIMIELKQGFTEKNLISNPHPSKVYRPPIFV